MKKSKTMNVVLKAACVVLVMYFSGYAVGRMAGKATKGVDFRDIFRVNEKYAAIVLTVLHAVIVIGGLITAFAKMISAKKAAEKWDGDDEDYIDSVESTLDHANIIGSTDMIFNTMLFASAVYFLEKSRVSAALFTLVTVVFLLGMAGALLLTDRCVDLVKKLNPEKQGSVFDPKFEKKWLDSCDEAQKQLTWQAGFTAYRAGNVACLFMWFLAFVLQTIMHYGLIPIICIGVIWLTMNTAYCVTAYKLEHKH